MPDALVARQPILDRRLDAFGYELLFRDGVADGAVVVDPSGATAMVALNTLTEIGVDRLVGSRTAWINVSRDFILDGYAKLLPPRVFVLELLEDQFIDRRLVDAVRELAGAGHRIALDDFVYSKELEPLIDIAEFVKLDLIGLGREGFGAHAKRLGERRLTLLAEKVETHDDYRYCRDQGCLLFQGYFFCRPELVVGGRVDATRTVILELLAALQAPGVELADLTPAIAQDPRLSYRLLRYLNSAFVGLGHEVRSIGQAVTMLGIENLRRWATLTLFTTVDGKPPELTRTALARARFCELCDADVAGATANELFTVGLLSVLDALLDMKLADALAQMSLAPDLIAAIANGAGAYANPLHAVLALERGASDQADSLVTDAEARYVASLIWADEAAGALFATAA